MFAEISFNVMTLPYGARTAKPFGQALPNFRAYILLQSFIMGVLWMVISKNYRLTLPGCAC